MAQAPPAPAPTIPRPTPVRPVPPPLNSPEGRAAAKAKADARRAEAEARARALPRWRKAFRATIPWLLAVFVAVLVALVYLAGYGVTEVGGQGMELHAGFSHLAELLGFLLILCGFLGGDKVTGILGVVLSAMFQLQYAFIYMATEPAVRALHPANGVAILAIAAMLAMKRPLWTRA